MSENSPQVVVVGSANTDLVVHAPRRPGPGETVMGGDLQILPGGKGANQAVAAAVLGASTAFVGCVGEDPHGDLVLASLRGAGVDVSAVSRVGTPTGVALIVLTPDGDNSIVLSPGANARISADLVDTALVRDAAVLLLQREIDPRVSLAAARCCRGTVVLTLAPSGPVPTPLLARTDVLVVNQHEAADLLGGRWDVGRNEAEAAAASLRRLGPRVAVVTLGADGAVAVDGHGSYVEPAPSVRVVDTTGAGDAFTGALGRQLAAGGTLPEALAVAVRVGAIAVGSPGAQPSSPSAWRAGLTAGPA